MNRDRKMEQGEMLKESSKDYSGFEITGRIIGCAFGVFKELGYGHREKVYQSALEQSFVENEVAYQREKSGNLKFHDKVVGKYFLDFLVDNMVAVELKVREKEYEKDISQLLDYMVSEGLPLGLLLKITRRGIVPKRLINSNGNNPRTSAVTFRGWL